MSTPLTEIDFSACRPLPGKIVLDLDPIPDHIGSLFIPDTARDQKVTDISHTGVVVAIGYGEIHEAGEVYPGLTPDEVKIGDRVVFRMMMTDLNERRIITDVRRVDAVVEP